MTIFLWSTIVSGAYFYAMQKLNVFRVSLLDEIVGLDITQMGLEKPAILDEILQIAGN